MYYLFQHNFFPSIYHNLLEFDCVISRRIEPVSWFLHFLLIYVREQIHDRYRINYTSLYCLQISDFARAESPICTWLGLSRSSDRVERWEREESTETSGEQTREREREWEMWKERISREKWRRFIWLMRNNSVLQTGYKGVGLEIDRKWSGNSMNYCWLLVGPFRLPRGFRFYGFRPFGSIDLPTKCNQIYREAHYVLHSFEGWAFSSQSIFLLLTTGYSLISFWEIY